MYVNILANTIHYSVHLYNYICITIVVSWTKGLRDIGQTINNVAVAKHVRGRAKKKDKGMLWDKDELTVSVS